MPAEDEKSKGEGLGVNAQPLTKQDETAEEAAVIMRGNGRGCPRLTSPALNAEPDGARAWSVSIGSLFGGFAISGQLYSAGIFIQPLMQTFNSDLSSTSLVSTLSLAMFYVSGLFITHVADHFGTRPVMMVGAVVWVGGCMLGSVATQLWHSILTQGVLCGFGAGAVYWPILAVLPQWFHKLRATGMGIAVLGSGLGQIAFSLGGEQLITELGWPNTLRIIGGMGGVLMAISILLVERRVAPVKNPKGTFHGIFQVIRELLGMSSARWFLSCSMFFQFSFFVPYTYVSVYCVFLGLSPEFGSFALSMIGIGSAAGRVFFGLIADYFGRLATFRVTVFLALVTVATWPTATSEATVLTFCFFYGFFAGGFASMFAPIAADLWGIQRMSGVFSLVNLVCIPGAFASGPLIGAIIDSYGYTPGIETAAAFMLASLFCICFCRKSGTPNSTVGQQQPLMGEQSAAASMAVAMDDKKLAECLSELERFGVHPEDFKKAADTEKDHYIRTLQLIHFKESNHLHEEVPINDYFSRALDFIKINSFDQVKQKCIERYGKAPEEWGYESLV